MLKRPLRNVTLPGKMAYAYEKSESYLEASRVELIDAANRGMMGRGAVVEAMFRLADTITAQEKTTKRLNCLLLAFTGTEHLS